MSKQTIEKILRSYKQKKSLVETTLARIEQYEYAIEHPEAWYKDYIPAGRELGMPGRPHGSPPAPVENYVIDKDLNIDIIKQWIEEDKSRIFFKKLEVKQIELAMDSLTAQEKYIIELKYFENAIWNSIESSFNREYRQKNYITVAGLRKINAVALDKLESILKPFYNQFGITFQEIAISK